MYNNHHGNVVSWEYLWLYSSRKCKTYGIFFKSQNSNLWNNTNSFHSNVFSRNRFLFLSLQLCEILKQNFLFHIKSVFICFGFFAGLLEDIRESCQKQTGGFDQSMKSKTEETIQIKDLSESSKHVVSFLPFVKDFIFSFFIQLSIIRITSETWPRDRL